MNITTKDISKGISTWAEHDLLNKGSLFQQGISTFIYLQAKPRLESLISGLNMLSDDGVFDYDELHKNVLQALQKMGGSYTIPVLDYTIDNADIEAIFSYMR